MMVCQDGERTIPPDDVIRDMDNGQLDQLARSLTSDADRDALNDAIIRTRVGYGRDSHSERTDTRRNRRRAKLLPIREELIPGRDEIEEHELQIALQTLAKHGLTRRQQQVWFLVDQAGLNHREAARMLGVCRSAVTRALSRAYAAFDRQAELEGVAIRELRASGRRGYFAPAHRPEVPQPIQNARRLVELADGLITVIIDLDRESFEVWNTHKEDKVEEGRRKPDGRVSFRAAQKAVERDLVVAGLDLARHSGESSLAIVKVVEDRLELIRLERHQGSDFKALVQWAADLLKHHDVCLAIADQVRTGDPLLDMLRGRLWEMEADVSVNGYTITKERRLQLMACLPHNLVPKEGPQLSPDMQIAFALAVHQARQVMHVKKTAGLLPSNVT